jgi:aminoglycoside phosphotransferase (APT) family kinase protein
MEHLDGISAPDVMPYTWGSWVTELPADEREAIVNEALEILVEIHALDVSPDVAAALGAPSDGGSHLEHHFAEQRAYYDWARTGRTFPTIERGFASLRSHWPQREPQARIGWGDARLGNILFAGVTPTAVLDWEMAAVVPPAMDLAWMVFFAEHLQRSALRRGLPGLPGFFDPESSVSRYERSSGTTVTDFDWYLCYAAVRESIISIRTMGRAVHFGQAPAPDDPEGLILGIDYLEELIDAIDHS